MPSPKPVAVLASGGLDSAVLLADLAGDRPVHPLYVRAGLAWEAEERAALDRYLAALGHRNVRPVQELAVDTRALLAGHWSVTGAGLPGADTPDSAVFIPGRNILLIGLAAVWCSLHAVPTVAIGSLGDNPFPDATPEFFAEYARAVSRGLGHEVAVVAPYRSLHKAELLRRFGDLPLEHTVTCMQPQAGVHCGTCNKCAERQLAFQQAGVADRTPYR
jgi:7-cyano-7-deazaguanine synthase